MAGLELDRALADNRRRWDELVGQHFESPFYDVPGFLAGAIRLDFLERGLLGEVAGKRLLHLQCHFGLGTLSWARLGADVTGLDFSQSAIEAARELAGRAGLPARFECGRVEQAPELCGEDFDIVFTSWGVLSWLPSLEPWAEAIARCLKPGGRFAIAEIHPVSLILEEEAGALVPRHDYFESDAPLTYEEATSYTGDGPELRHRRAHNWAYELGAIVGRLVGNGMRIEQLREYDFASYRQFPSMIQDEDGWWRLPAGAPRLPLSFTLTAVKTGSG